MRFFLATTWACATPAWEVGSPVQGSQRSVYVACLPRRFWPRFAALMCTLGCYSGSHPTPRLGSSWTSRMCCAWRGNRPKQRWLPALQRIIVHLAEQTHHNYSVELCVNNVRPVMQSGMRGFAHKAAMQRIWSGTLWHAGLHHEERRVCHFQILSSARMIAVRTQAWKKRGWWWWGRGAAERRGRSSPHCVAVSSPERKVLGAKTTPWQTGSPDEKPVGRPRLEVRHIDQSRNEGQAILHCTRTRFALCTPAHARTIRTVAGRGRHHAPHDPLMSHSRASSNSASLLLQRFSNFSVAAQ